MYTVHRSWAQARYEAISCFPWTTEDDFPRTEFRLRWDDEALSARFNVRESAIRCLCTTYGGPVWEDSCVELFFSPGTPGYFNLEVNCGGTFLLAYQTARDENRILIPFEEASKVQVLSTLPSVIDPEIQKETVWMIEWHLPYSILESVMPIQRPAVGVEWKANLYKCAENNSRPHYGSWSAIGTPKPDFHRPDFFNTIRFEA